MANLLMRDRKMNKRFNHERYETHEKKSCRIKSEICSIDHTREKRLSQSFRSRFIVRGSLMPVLRFLDFGLAVRRIQMLVVMWLLTSAGRTVAIAVEPPESRSATGYRALVDKHQREALLSVADYLARHPDADDAEMAAQWLFETAVAQGLEAEV